MERLEPALADLRRLESQFVRVRWAAVAFALLHAAAFARSDGLTWRLLVPYAGLVVGNLLVARGLRDVDDHGIRRVALAATALDAAIIAGTVALWAADELVTPWPLLVLVPYVAAARFQLAGALAGSAVAGGAYVVICLVRSEIPVEVAFKPATLVFRGGLVLLVAVVVGLLTEDHVRQRRLARDAIRELQSLEQWRRRVVAMLGHDVRGPLGLVVQSAELLRDRGEELGEDERAQVVASIARQGARVQGLAADLLDLARLEHGNFHLDRAVVDVRDTIDQAVRYLAQSWAVEVVVPDGLQAYVDPARIEQVIVNLVGNAVRHGEPPVTVEAHPDGPDLVLTVTDEGPGVPDELVDRLFTEFGVGTDRESVGLGLWIVGALVEAHGGTVAYARPAGRGARFTVALAGAVAAAERADDAPHGSGEVADPVA